MNKSEPTLQKKPTLRMIAQELGVSVMTVSRALNSHQSVSSRMRQKVLLKVCELGYDYRDASRVIGSQREKRVAVFCSDQKLYDDWQCNIFMRLHYLLLKRLKSAGFESVLLDLSNKDDDLAKLAECGSLLILGPFTDGRNTEDDLFAQVKTTYGHVNIITVLGQGHDVLSVVPDDYGGGVMAARKIVAVGHSHVAVFSRKHETSYRRRFAGFAGEMFRLCPQARIDQLFIDQRDDSAEEDQLRTEALDAFFAKQAHDLPTVFFALNCYMSAFLLNYLRAKHYDVPKDFSLFGYDNMDIIANCTPDITRIYFDLKQLAYGAVTAVKMRLTEDRFIDNSTLVTPNEFIAGKTLGILGGK